MEIKNRRLLVSADCCGTVKKTKECLEQIPRFPALITILQAVVKSKAIVLCKRHEFLHKLRHIFVQLRSPLLFGMGVQFDQQTLGLVLHQRVVRPGMRLNSFLY